MGTSRYSGLLEDWSLRGAGHVPAVHAVHVSGKYGNRGLMIIVMIIKIVVLVYNNNNNNDNDKNYDADDDDANNNKQYNSDKNLLYNT